MKFNKSLKAFALILLLISLLTAMGCGNKGNESSTGNNSENQGSTNESPAPTSKYTKDKPLLIKFAHVTTSDSPKGKAADKFKELIEQYTDGIVKVEVYPSSQLYGDKDEMEALQLGNVQIIAPSVTKLVGLNPQFQIVDLPFLFKDRDAVIKFWDGEDGQKLMNSLEDKNITGIAMWENGFKHFTSNKPLVNPEDFKGQLFRTQSGKVLDAQFKALGAGNQVIPFGETYTALQQGTIDGQENTYNNMDTQKYVEVQKYLLISEHGRLDYAVIVNSNWYKGLEPEIKEAFDKAMKEATEYERQLAVELDKESHDNLVNSGKLIVNTVSLEDRQKYQEMMQPVYEEFAEVIGKELIEKLKNQ